MSERALQSAEALRQALDLVGDALASPDLEGLLRGEAAIERALADLPSTLDVPAAERAGIRTELEQARAALMRCRRLGAALTDFTRVTLEAQGRAAGYGRHDVATGGLAGRTLNTRA